MKKVLFCFILFLKSLSLMSQNSLLIGVKVGPTFSRANISDSRDVLSSPVSVFYSLGIPFNFYIKENNILKLYFNYALKGIAIKDKSWDNLSFGGSTITYDTKEIKIIYAYKFKQIKKYDYYVGLGPSIDFSTLWKTGKAPGEGVDTNSFSFNGNDLETRTNLSLCAILGLEKQLKKNRKISLECSYNQGLKAIQTFYITLNHQGNYIKESYATKGSYFALNVHFYFLKLNIKKNQQTNI